MRICFYKSNQKLSSAIEAHEEQEADHIYYLRGVVLGGSAAASIDGLLPRMLALVGGSI